MPRHSSPAIKASGLVKRYGTDVVALDGLDIDVEEGSIFGLLGPNGAGKSTTVKILTTLVRPDDGSASVMGADVLESPIWFEGESAWLVSGSPLIRMPRVARTWSCRAFSTGSAARSCASASMRCSRASA